MRYRILPTIAALLLIWAPDVAFAQGKSIAEDHVMLGDMLLERDRLYGLDVQPTGRGPEGGAVFSYSSLPWPGGVVVVQFIDSITPERRELFWTACRAWAESGVRCVPYTGQATYVVVRDDLTSGCFAGVGTLRREPSLIHLASTCWNTRTIAHEIGHSLGLIHEHQRADRDQYIRVEWDNIEPTGRGNFELVSQSRPLGPYDFMSLMHYLPSQLSRGGLPTMVPLPPHEQFAKTMGSALLPSAADISAVKFIYNSGLYADIKFDTNEVLRAMLRLDALYTTELKRPNGLSLGGEPDFSGVSTWIFSVYLTSRAGGLDEADAFYNVQALISQSDEWRMRNQGRSPLAPKPVSSPLRLDQGEFMEVMYRLSDLYRSELKRPAGLAINGKPDFSGLSTWVVHVYMNSRMSGASQADAWSEVVALVQDSDEWRLNNPGR
jgi:hypothetical protein